MTGGAVLVDAVRLDGGVVTCGNPSGRCCVVASQVSGRVLFLLSVGPAVGVCAPVFRLSPILDSDSPRDTIDSIEGTVPIDRFTLSAANKSDLDKVLRDLPGVTLSCCQACRQCGTGWQFLPRPDACQDRQPVHSARSHGRPQCLWAHRDLAGTANPVRLSLVSESSLKLGYHRSAARVCMRGITGEGLLDWFRLDGAASTRYIRRS